MRASILGLMVGFVLWTGEPAWAAADKRDRCDVPEELRSTSYPLAEFSKRLKQSDHLAVVVLGSASSLPGGTARQAPPYVVGMEAALQEAFPGKTFTLRNLSSRAQANAQMVQRIGPEVIPARPDLVIWQTGTVEAARHVDINAFSATLAAGLTDLQAARIDVVLMGPQLRSRLATMIDVEPYNDVMAQIADRESVPFLSRYDIMRHWDENAVFDLGSQDQAIQMREAGAQNRCIMLLLVEQIRGAATVTP